MATILIVEDDPLLSSMYAKLFESEHFQVVTAEDGQVGLDKAQSSKPSLVLLDIMMPKLNGMEVLKKLKSDPSTKDIPVVVLTNLSGVGDADRALMLGAVKYIIKSENKPSEVFSIVKSVLDGNRKHETPSA